MDQHPLDTPRRIASAHGGDLENAARLYAKRASYAGRDRSLWKVWLAIQAERGLDLTHSLAELSAQDRRWLGVTSLKHGPVDAGLAAYARYLKAPGKIGPFSNETLPFLATLARVGRGEEALSWVDELEARSDHTPAETLWAATYLLDAGRPADARQRIEPLLARHHDWANVWAVSALVALAQGDRARADADARKAAKRRFAPDDPLRDRLIENLGDGWQTLAKAHEPPPSDYERNMSAFLRTPPLILQPSDEPEPHWYGGDDFIMPACRGCQHPIRQWFSLDVTRIDDLMQKLPSWPRIPLLGCADCMLWMGRHDYLVEHATRRISLRSVALSIKEYGTTHRTTPALERRFAKLQRLVPTASPFDDDLQPFVGGVPLWTQSPEQALCPGCDEVMIYVASMAAPPLFDAPFSINNDSGYQYHFACDTCRILSVIAQWT